MSWPESPYAVIRWRLATLQADSTDPHPDWVPAVGTQITLTPSITGAIVHTRDDGTRTTLTVARVEGIIDADGWLVATGGDGRPLHIAATDDPSLSVTGWTWTASIVSPSIRVPFAARAGEIVDLSDYVLVPAVDASRQWVERIPELIAAATALEDAPQLVADAETAAERAETAAETATSAAGAALTSRQAAETAADHATYTLADILAAVDVVEVGQHVYVPERDVSGILDLSAETTRQPIIHLRLVGNITTVLLPSDPPPGRTITLILRQDSVGGRTIAWPTGLRAAWAAPPALTGTAGSIDMIHLLAVGPWWIVLPAASNIAALP